MGTKYLSPEDIFRLIIRNVSIDYFDNKIKAVLYHTIILEPILVVSVTFYIKNNNEWVTTIDIDKDESIFVSHTLCTLIEKTLVKIFGPIFKYRK